MSSAMHIDLGWLPPFQGPPEVGRTSAALQIRFGAEVATRFDDGFSQSVENAARVSAFPLALWLAQSWWRLRWEPSPVRTRLLPDEFAANANWRMSHELPAAGYGFIWPRLVFASDGESLRVRCSPSPPRSDEPARYLSEFDVSVSAPDFERVVDDFIDLVMRRLDTLGDTELHVLWKEVLAERADPVQAAVRKIEACLGCDPDEAPHALLKRFLDLASEAGGNAVDEIAPVCAGSRPAESFNDVLALASQPGVPGRIAMPLTRHAADRELPPWQRGRLLAEEVRRILGFGSQPLEDEALADILQIRAADLSGPTGSPAFHAPMGLAVRNGSGGRIKLLFRKKNRPGRRFEAARFLADHLCASTQDHWLPVSDALTARQKVQRAFAAEFLCPINSLRDYLGDEVLPEALEDAAEYFGVSEMAVGTHLLNNHLIPHSLAESLNTL